MTKKAEQKPAPKIEHTITLRFGHTDDKGVVHKEVTFGRRLNCQMLMAIDRMPETESNTQHNDLIIRMAMTKFGTIKMMPPQLTVLLGLNRIDRGLLNRGYSAYIAKSRGGRAPEYRENNTVRLPFGFNINGLTYDLVEMNRMTTGHDELAADNLGLTGLGRDMFLLGRSISKLGSTEDPGQTMEGPIDLIAFNDLDQDDYLALREGGLLADLFFRIQGEEISGDRAGSESDTGGEGDRVEREGNSGDAQQEA